jgi:hypothetical protein
MIRILLTFLSLLVIWGCTPTVKFTTELPTPEKPGIRGFLELNDYVFLSTSETETITGFIGFTHQNRLCKALGGTLYVYKPEVIDTYEGRKFKETELEYDKVSTFDLTKLSLKTKCKRGDETIFSVNDVIETGRYGTAVCRTSIITHQKEPIIDIGVKGREVIKNKDLSFKDFIVKVAEAKELPDGSFKIGTIGEDTCHPYDFPRYVSMLATYCYQKGGRMVVNGKDYKDFIKSMVGDRNWKYKMLEKEYSEYSCLSSEPFTVKVVEDKARTSSNMAYNIPQVGVMYYIKSGAREAESLSSSTVSPQQVSRDPLEDLILMTAHQKAPQILTQGAMKYRTTYNYSDGACDYVSLFMDVEGLGREKTLNYKVCNNQIQPLGEEQDYFRGAPQEVYRAAKKIERNCSLYGQASTTYNGFRINCRVLNPSKPCMVELTITHNGKLIKQEVTNACK